MREILFRGQTRKKGEKVRLDGSPIDSNWVYGGIFPNNKGGDFAIIYQQEPTIEKFTVYADTVGQYTGLLDKNGKRIFEGDILKCHDNPKDLVKVVFDEFGVVDTDTERPVDTVIGWHYEVIPTDELSTVEPFCLSMPLTKSYIEYCHMEVIGNIHDDSDLIKQES